MGEVMAKDLQDEQEAIALKYGYPFSLARACCDPANYLLEADGMVFEFVDATPLTGGFVMLNGIRSECFEGHKFPYGVEVRVASIAWVAAAERLDTARTI